jgi:hypothetical protein
MLAPARPIITPEAAWGIKILTENEGAEEEDDDEEAPGVRGSYS